METYFGRGLASGDVDGDAAADLLVGAPGGLVPPGVLGAVLLFRGDPGPLGTTPSLALPGASVGDGFGTIIR